MIYDDTVSTNAPTVYIKNEEATGTDLVDISANALTGGVYAGSGVTLRGYGPTVREVGYGADLDGLSGSWSGPNLTAALRPAYPYTLETWARGNPVGGVVASALTLTASDQSEVASIQTTAADQWRFNVGNAVEDSIQTGGRVTGDYQHLVIRAVGAAERYYYIDGVLLAANTETVAWSGAVATYNMLGGWNGTGQFFEGGLSRAALYPSDLGEDGVVARYRAGVLSPLYQGVIARLKADARLLALSSGRIYAEQLPDDQALPGVRVALLDDMPHHRLASGDHFDATVQVDAYAHRSDEGTAWAMGLRALAALDRQVVQVPGYQPGKSSCGDRPTAFRESSVYRIRSTYKIKANT